MNADRVDATGPALPASAGRLIGRATELAHLHELLTSGEVRLLTLCGVGGIGKTRLALEVARAAQPAFADGARFVDLTPFREPALVLSAMHASVPPGQPTGRRPVLDALKRALDKRHLLLVLDNFEPVLDAAPRVAELLAACPGLTILATSRAPLRLSWEREFVVGPLVIPPLHLDRRPEALLACPSVALLVERMVGVGVAPSGAPADLVALAGICRRLDGIPLAIELAAARTKVLAPPALLARLDRPLELLTTGARDAPTRHQALRTTFDWSYRSLADEDRRLFRRLGTFVGGCTFEAAARVCEADAPDEARFVDALGRVVDSGLVQVDQAAAPEPRLVLLEPVRDYAVEQLQASGEDDAVQQRHAITYLELAERANRELRGPNEREWVARLDHDHGNALVALRWFVEHGDAERGLCLAGALSYFWWVRGFVREGLERMEEVLALPAPDPPSPALAAARARALSMASAAMFWRGEFQAANAYLRAALALYGDTGNPGHRAFALTTLADCALAVGDLGRAEQWHAQALALYCAADDQQGSALALTNLGRVAFYGGDYDHATALLSQSLQRSRAAGNARNVATALRCLAMVHSHRGDFDAAQACVRESLSFWRDERDRGSLPYLLEAAALVAVATGERPLGLRVAAGAAALREELDTPGTPAWMRELNRWLDTARATLGEEASSKAWAEGLALGVEGVVAGALSTGESAAVLEAMPSGLTRRETEVLRLVASGSTNKDIASQLSVSVATVERHLATIYGKIGARGRVDAAAFAITRGLLAPTP